MCAVAGRLPCLTAAVVEQGCHDRTRGTPAAESEVGHSQPVLAQGRHAHLKRSSLLLMVLLTPASSASRPPTLWPSPRRRATASRLKLRPAHRREPALLVPERQGQSAWTSMSMLSRWPRNCSRPPTHKTRGRRMRPDWTARCGALPLWCRSRAHSLAAGATAVTPAVEPLYRCWQIADHGLGLTVDEL